MGAKRIIRKGDTTTHGGTVLEGISNFQVHGKPASVIGHMVMGTAHSGSSLDLA